MKHKKLIVAIALVLLITMLSNLLLEGTDWPYKDIVVCFALPAIMFSGNIYWKTLVKDRYVTFLWMAAYIITFVYCAVSSFGRHLLGWDRPIHHFFCLSPVPFVVIYFISKLSQYNSQNNESE